MSLLSWTVSPRGKECQLDRAGPSDARNKVFEGDAGEGEQMWKEHRPILILPMSLGLGSKQES